MWAIKSFNSNHSYYFLFFSSVILIFYISLYPFLLIFWTPSFRLFAAHNAEMPFMWQYVWNPNTTLNLTNDTKRSTKMPLYRFESAYMDCYLCENNLLTLDKKESNRNSHVRYASIAVCRRLNSRATDSSLFRFAVLWRCCHLIDLIIAVVGVNFCRSCLFTFEIVKNNSVCFGTAWECHLLRLQKLSKFSVRFFQIFSSVIHQFV